VRYPRWTLLALRPMPSANVSRASTLRLPSMTNHLRDEAISLEMYGPPHNLMHSSKACRSD
jgi:hypothetical protein